MAKSTPEGAVETSTKKEGQGIPPSFAQLCVQRRCNVWKTKMSSSKIFGK